MQSVDMSVTVKGILLKFDSKMFPPEKGIYMLLTDGFGPTISVRQMKECVTGDDPNKPHESTLLIPDLSEYFGKYVEIKGRLVLQTIDNGSFAVNGANWGSVSIFIEDIKVIPQPEPTHLDYGDVCEDDEG